jgi:outer membrane protein assembly factor BamB
MGALTRTCPQCTTDNEIDTQVVPMDMRAISCWFCAASIPVTKQGMMEARARPSMLEVQAPRGPTVGEAAEKGGLPPLLPWVGGALGVILLLTLAICGVRSLSRETAPLVGDQFRGSYHGGDKRPAGTAAWQKTVASSSGFAPARSAKMLFVAANQPRAQEADSYSPAEVPDSILPRLRKLHRSLITEGFLPHGVPETTALRPAQRDRFRTEMDQGSCYRVYAFGGEKVRNVELMLYQPDGLRLIMADPRSGKDASLEYCPAKLGNYEFELRMRRGYGRVTHVAYRESNEPFHDMGRLYAFDQATGDRRWQLDLEEEVASAPASTERYVVVGTRTRARSAGSRARVEGGNVQVFATADGERVCSFEAAGPVVSSPVVGVGGAKGFFGSCASSGGDGDTCAPDGTASPVYAIDLESCSELWQYTARVPVTTSLTVDAERVYVVAGRRLVALEIADGAVAWAADLSADASAAVLDGQHVIVGSSNNVRAHDRTNGEVVWTTALDQPVAGMPGTTREMLYVGLADGSLLALGTSDGVRQWELPLGGRLDSAITIAAGLVVVAAQGRVAAIDAEEGTLAFEVPVPQGFRPGTSTILFDGVLYATDRAGTVHAIR